MTKKRIHNIGKYGKWKFPFPVRFTQHNGHWQFYSKTEATFLIWENNQTFYITVYRYLLRIGATKFNTND